MIMLGGWLFDVVIDGVDTIEAIRKDMYVVVDFLCVGKG